MKFLEELKAAQAILGRFDVPPIDMVWDDAFFSVSEREQLAAVLRRIPQLIEVVEWIEREHIRMDENETKNGGNSEYEYGILHVTTKLLSKLEGKKDE